MPQCFQQFELCWAEGNYPMAGQSKLGFWWMVSFYSSVASKSRNEISRSIWIDGCGPPGVLPMFKTPAPASSLTGKITYLQPIAHQVQDWSKYKVVTEYAETWILFNRVPIFGMMKID